MKQKSRPARPAMAWPGLLYFICHSRNPAVGLAKIDDKGNMNQHSGRTEPLWATWGDERLLNLPIRRLGVNLHSPFLTAQIERLHQELEAKRLRFRPHCWLSNEWFTPDGVPGIAIPFYLAHPRLIKLELNQMLEVEGGTSEWCMRILRHEAGHAIENAYRIRRLHSRQRIFGRSSEPYPKYYSPRPYSRSYVRHLDLWYAQSHPDEDFAETFAVWLTPDSMWADRYKGWPVLRKLHYMDGLMRDLEGVAPKVTTTETVDPVHSLKRTLREHYDRKRVHYGIERPSSYDPDLKRLFSETSLHTDRTSAAVFLKRFRREVRRKVAGWTGEYQYTIDQVLEDMILRCQELRLRVPAPEEQVKLDFTILLTMHTMNYLRSGRHKVAV